MSVRNVKSGTSVRSFRVRIIMSPDCVKGVLSIEKCFKFYSA